MGSLSKSYEPKKYEDNIYISWEDSGFFAPEVHPPWVGDPDDPNRKYFSMVLPPPNVTGTLHMGHATMLAIQDLMARYHRMKGEKTLWLPGTDHAAVATETKVEKMLIESGEFTKPKEELGREKFLERVNKFAQESHDTIVNQSKKMGSSLDWSREAFTLDDKRNLAVKTVFKKMYDDGLIYHGYRVINWSVKGQSTCSDDELVYVERPAKLYTFKYSKDVPIIIATTRPETKLGDTAIAVNPNGKWKKYIGQEFVVENFGQAGHILKLKIIGDEHVDESFGTGALGVTPTHSPIDFEMYQKQKALGNDIGLIQVIGEDGKMTAGSGDGYFGLTVEEARNKVVAWLKAENLLEKEEDITQNVSTSDRFGDIVEPLPKTQWFIDVNKKFNVQSSEFVGKLELDGIEEGKEYSLKEIMQTVVRTKQIKIVPERFEKVYFNWINNLRDWCISRQIWYGHQIPVWYREGNGEPSQTAGKRGTGNEGIHVGVEAPKDMENWEQDPDTLDTWFSSGLWTFSTLGWPENTVDLKNFHPTSVLETGYDIIFFWVARMILMTTYTLGQVPFETVYLHGLVRDEQGRKMSKSLGNIINPLDMIDKYGTDATRLSLLIGSTPGNDVKLSEEKVAGFRNFSNKIWNMARFIEMTVDGEGKKLVKNIDLPVANTLADKWILAKLEEVKKVFIENLESMNFSYAGEKLRDFTWNDLADWYLEIAKIESSSAEASAGKGNKPEILNYILNTVLKLWHPYMPFVTETIWQEFYGKENILMVEKFPEVSSELSEETDFVFVQNIITGIRSVKGDYKIDPVKKLNVNILAGDKKELLIENSAVIMKLARLENLHIEEKIEKPAESVSFVESGIEIFVELSGIVNFAKEKERLGKEIEQLNKYIVSLQGKLNNPGFVNSAPAHILEQEKIKLTEAQEKLDKLNKQFGNI